MQHLWVLLLLSIPIFVNDTKADELSILGTAFIGLADVLEASGDPEFAD